MKANELMIGDYINYRGQIIKVTSLYDKGGSNEVGWSDKESVWVNADNVEPIPLTTEILEKNGFEKVQIHGEKQDDIFQCFDNEIIIEVGIYDPNFILIHYRNETPDGINSGELSSIVKVDGGKFYLHELQHALRLCGIKKEIVL